MAEEFAAGFVRHMTAYLVRDGDGYAPTPIAQGPWGPIVSGHVVGESWGGRLSGQRVLRTCSPPG